jgi:hypothetical protein
MARGCAELNDRLAASAYTSSLAGEMSIVRVALGKVPVHDPFDASAALAPRE